MRGLLVATLATATLTFAVSISTPVRAADAADPSVHQIYEAAQAGHYDQAQTMMDQVLKDHPKSERAHYVQAELYAKQGKTALARSELAQAEEIDPALTHEKPASVQALKSELGMQSRSGAAPRLIGMTQSQGLHFPWGAVLVLVAVVGVLWMLFRRRSSYGQYPAGAPVMGGGPAGGPGYGGSGYGGPGPMGGGMGGGMGSGIVGGLASGLAVGAGVVAGEEIAHRFMDGGQRSGTVAAPDSNEWQQPSNNADMGGSDFGVNDAGSWDDSSSGGGGGGGGDDWT